LFSGAKRTLSNNEGDTPLDMLENNSAGIDEHDYIKMKYVLT